MSDTEPTPGDELVKKKGSTLEQLMDEMDKMALSQIRLVQAKQKQQSKPDFDGDYVSVAESAKMFDTVARYLEGRMRSAPNGGQTAKKGKFSGIRSEYRRLQGDKA